MRRLQTLEALVILMYISFTDFIILNTIFVSPFTHDSLLLSLTYFLSRTQLSNLPPVSIPLFAAREAAPDLTD